jgi:hypothetical protein
MMTRSWRPLLDGSLVRTGDAVYLAELISHRVLRYGSGILHLVLFGSSAVLVEEGPVYAVAFVGQLGLLALAYAGRRRLPIPGAALAYYYLLTTAATVDALVRYLRAGSPATWAKAEGTR